MESHVPISKHKLKSTSISLWFPSFNTHLVLNITYASDFYSFNLTATSLQKNLSFLMCILQKCLWKSNLCFFKAIFKKFLGIHKIKRKVWRYAIYPHIYAHLFPLPTSLNKRCRLTRINLLMIIITQCSYFTQGAHSWYSTFNRFG